MPLCNDSSTSSASPGLSRLLSRPSSFMASAVLRNPGQDCVVCPSTGLCLIFFSPSDWGHGFGGAHGGKCPSHHIILRAPANKMTILSKQLKNYVPLIGWNMNYLQLLDILYKIHNNMKSWAPYVCVCKNTKV